MLYPSHQHRLQMNSVLRFLVLKKYHLFYDKPEVEWMDDYIIVDNEKMSYLILSAAMDGYEHSDII